MQSDTNLALKSILIITLLWTQEAFAQFRPGVLLPDSQEFVSWEVPFQFIKTYYVNNRNPIASDENSGSRESPFLTINRAAQILQPGERVVVMGGVHREQIIPQQGGTGSDKIISYEAAPGEKVIVKGSQLIKVGWESSTGFSLAGKIIPPITMKIYQLDLAQLEFNGYNPFAIANVMMDRSFLKPKPEELKPYLLRRGMVFVDGYRLEQVEMYRDMLYRDGTFWVEHNGMNLHVRLQGNADPSMHEVELVTHEQVFAPEKRYLGYIRVKGFTFEYGASGFPVPQHGLVSTTCGHHWIIEECNIQHANSVALDIGNQDWNYEPAPQSGYMIVRRNHISDAGICGIAGMTAVHSLIEYNILENIGWQNAELAWESGGIYLEASQYQNMIDHNIIWKVTRGKGGSVSNIVNEGGWGIITDGSDETIIAHNLLSYCEDAGVITRTVEGRIVENRGGTSLWNQVLNNIFFQCGRSIVFSHKDNTAEGNVYDKSGWNRGIGLNWITIPESLRLDLPAWQKYFGFDKQGFSTNLNFILDLDSLTLTYSVSGDIPVLSTSKHFHQDLLGTAIGNRCLPGPINSLQEAEQKISIDPIPKGNQAIMFN